MFSKEIEMINEARILRIYIPDLKQRFSTPAE